MEIHVDEEPALGSLEEFQAEAAADEQLVGVIIGIGARLEIEFVHDPLDGPRRAEAQTDVSGRRISVMMGGPDEEVGSPGQADRQGGVVVDVPEIGPFPFRLQGQLRKEKAGQIEVQDHDVAEAAAASDVRPVSQSQLDVVAPHPDPAGELVEVEDVGIQDGRQVAAEMVERDFEGDAVRDPRLQPAADPEIDRPLLAAVDPLEVADVQRGPAAAQQRQRPIERESRLVEPPLQRIDPDLRLHRRMRLRPLRSLLRLFAGFLSHCRTHR